MTTPTTFAFPTTVHFGAGVRWQLANELSKRDIKRPLLVTDSKLATLEWFTAIAHHLSAHASLDACVFSGIEGNPTAAQVYAGVQAFRKEKADAIIAIGGGAPTDVAKAIALMATHPGSVFDYSEDAATPRKRTFALPPLFAIPTAAGTGSEVGRSAVIAENDTHRKRLIFDPALLPQSVFADPELLVGLPREATAWTGMDALCHLVESYLAKGYHPMCDAIALEGLSLVDKALVRSTTHPDDIEARGAMLMASIMGAVAFQKGLGITHAGAHALSAVCDLHHGLANAILMPYALRHNAGCCEERFTRMAKVLELDEPSPKAFFTWLEGLRTAIGIPDKLSEVGVKPEHIDGLVALTSEDGCLATNPTPASEAELRAIFERAL